MAGLLLYNIFVRLLQAFMHVAAFFSQKASLWVQGRQGWRRALKEELAQAGHTDLSKVVWMHASSLGEFEQGRPIVEQLKKDNPSLFIVVSFFSPSGYLAAKQFNHADLITYLPLDTASNARTFVEIIRPQLVLWIKYEYWYHYLHQTWVRRIPLLLVAAVFLPRHPFFKWYGGLHRKMLTFFNAVFVQEEQSFKQLATLSLPITVSVGGDSRFDRVCAIAAHWQGIPEVEAAIDRQKWIVVAGSTWPEDHVAIEHCRNAFTNLQWLIAPHHIDENALNKAEKTLPGAVRLSNYNPNNNTTPDIILVDSMGILSRLYKYGMVCYVGGGFSATGIHNILEAAVYGRPVLFGPKYHDYREAEALLLAKGAFSVQNSDELISRMKQLLEQHDDYGKTSQNSAHFVQQHSGATKKILDYIYKNRLLTS